MNMTNCNLCPRKCSVNRTSALGYCGQTNEIRVARAAPHMWEEPCISGKSGSGTVFFCGCTLGCVYCQNAAISRAHSTKNGKCVTIEQLSDIFINLQNQGVHNINLVTPTMFAIDIAEAIKLARGRGLSLPVIYNTSGYESSDVLERISETIDIYLPDFKYVSSELSAKYSHVTDYPKYAADSLDFMVKRIGEAQFDKDGMMTRGVIVRHLLLPGHLDESRGVLDFLFARYGNSIFYSLMNQYTPMPTLDTELYPELSRKVTTYEYQKLINYAQTLGIRNGFIQDGGTAKESFIPAFNGDGVDL